MTERQRSSDSPLVDTIWHGIAEQDGQFTAPADGRWELIVKCEGKRTMLLVSGPTTKAVPTSFRAGTEILSIKFHLGVFMPALPMLSVLDVQSALPEATSCTFWLHSRAWEIPTYENADTFVSWLTRDAALTCDPLIQGVLRDEPQYWSIHTIRRRFLHATGFTQIKLRQIERARRAADLLMAGTPILDTLEATGYFDQAHLTKALRHFIGHTPGQIAQLHASP